MRFKRRRDWKQGRSISEGRAKGGQIILKRRGKEAGEDTFLVRIGKRGAKTVRGAREDAERTLEELRRNLEGGSYRPSSNLLLGTFLERHFLPWKRLSVKPKTFGGYADVVSTRIIPVLGNHLLQRLTEAHVQEWVDGLWQDGLTPKTVRNYVAVLRAALGRAVALGLLQDNPFARVDVRRREPEWWLADPDTTGIGESQGIDRSRVWDRAELETFCRRAKPDDEMTRWVIIGLRTGLRPQEQCGLRWVDVDLDRGLVRVRGAIIEVDKSRRAQYGRWVYGGPKTWWRDVTASSDLLGVLRAQRTHVRNLVDAGTLDEERAKFVFPARRGPRPFNNPSNIKDRLRHAIIGRHGRKSANGISGVRYIPPYGMRHTHATDLLRHGWSVFNVSKRLGTSVTMIERHYGHLLTDMEEDALEEMTPLPGYGPDAHAHPAALRSSGSSRVA